MHGRRIEPWLPLWRIQVFRSTATGHQK